MARYSAVQRLAEADRKGVWAFTPATLSALLGGVEPGYLRLMLKRLTDRGVLVRAARGLYVNPNARSMPADNRAGLIRFLRPRAISYISLEWRLSEAGVISQVATALTCMTTGSPGHFVTPWGVIEFVHTDRAVVVGTDVRLREDGVLEASVARAARDLRRVGRNTDLIDNEILAQVQADETEHDHQPVQP
jgi:hypothetical protein